MEPRIDKTPVHGMILVVDDDPDLLKMLRRFLGRMLPGAHVLGASDAEHALDIMDQHGVDVILADYRLPRANGVELLGYLRRHYPQTRRIMLTGDPDDGLALTASRDAGTERFFMKPLDLNALSRVLEQMLRATTVHPSPGAAR